MTSKSSSYSPLCQPLTLACGLVLPNRLVKAAMTEALADDWGRPTPKLCSLYQNWASSYDHDGGGIGTLITGNIQVDRRSVERPGNVCIDKMDPQYDSEESMELLRQFAKAGSADTNKSVMIAQLSHPGRQANGMINLNRIVGPGDVKLNMPGAKIAFGTPRPLEATEIEQEIVPRFVYAAKLCQDAGFDGVQLHAAHGYLFSSFLNPRANNRTKLFGADDPYGGSLERRAKLLLDVVEAIQRATHDSSIKNQKPFAIAVKLNSADFQLGGFTSEEAVQVAVWLERAGVDLLEISGGNYETGAFYLSNTDMPQKHKKESTRRREAFFLEYAIEIQAAITKMPVMVTGGWRTRAAMETAIQRGDCALIGLGRPLCGNPEGGAQLLAGGIEELPSYEMTLPEGDFLTRICSAVCCCGKKRFGPFLQMMALQSWFYRSIICVSETSKGAEPGTMGLWQAFWANLRHENLLAQDLKGVDCVGNVYKGLKNT